MSVGNFLDPDQPQDFIKPTRDNIMAAGGQGILLFQAGRHGTAAVAKSFLHKTKNRPYGLLHHDSHGEKEPETLNFWVTVDLTSTSDGVQTGTIKNVTLGQGLSND